MKILNQYEHGCVIYSLPDGTELEVSCITMSGEDIEPLNCHAAFTKALAIYVALNGVRDDNSSA